MRGRRSGWTAAKRQQTPASDSECAKHGYDLCPQNTSGSPLAAFSNLFTAVYQQETKSGKTTFIVEIHALIIEIITP